MVCIDRFQGEYRWLSNFWPSPIEIYGVRFASVEQAYQWWKIDPSDTQGQSAVMSATTPGDAKRAGRRARKRDGWDSMKVEVMRYLIQLKFGDASLRALLLATGDAELVEGNTWNDNFWGVCNGWGENHLGRLLMQVRDEIRTRA